MAGLGTLGRFVRLGGSGCSRRRSGYGFSFGLTFWIEPSSEDRALNERRRAFELRPLSEVDEDGEFSRVELAVAVGVGNREGASDVL